MERGEMRWAWVATTETELADRMAGAMAPDVEEEVSNNCDSEDRREVGQEGMDASVWSTEEGDGYSLVSAHSTNESFFNYPPEESPHQRAPAERPLSPACEHTNAHLTPKRFNDLSLVSKHTTNIMRPPLQNAHQGASLSSSSKETEPQFAANNFSDGQLTSLHLTTFITQNGSKTCAEHLKKLSENLADVQVHNQTEVKAKMAFLPQEETSLSYIMDPLSMSLLDVDQQAATASFLQGEQSNNSSCPLENERKGHEREVEKERLTCAEMEGKGLKDEDVKFNLSLLELPSTSDIMTAANHTKQIKESYCGIGKCVSYVCLQIND